MGEADRYIDYRDDKPKRFFSLGQPGNPLMILFTINVVVFLLLFITRLFFLFTNQTGNPEVLQYNFTQWVAVPSNINEWLHKPWTLLSYMFSHGGIGDMFPVILATLSNMLWLWAFGFILQDIAGNKHLVPIYIYGGLLGAIFFIICCLAFPSFKQNYLLGANCSVAAVAIAATVLQPSYRMFAHLGTGIPLWVLMLIYAVINLLPLIGGIQPHVVAFLGGCIAGYVYVFFLKKNTDMGKWMNHFYKWFIGNFKSTDIVKEKQFYNTGNRNPYTKSANISQKNIDTILDKINLKGYQSLTQEEKNILKRASES